MKKSVKLAAFLLALLAVLLAFASCGGEKTTDDPGPSQESKEPVVESPAPQLSVGERGSIPVVNWD